MTTVIDYKGYSVSTNEGHCALVYRGENLIKPFSGSTLEDAVNKAKAFIDANLKLKAMPDKQAALSKLSGHCELENGQQSADEFTNWMEDEAEKQNHEHE